MTKTCNRCNHVFVVVGRCPNCGCPEYRINDE